MSEFSARLLDSDGEVQASLVVAQLERRRPHAFAHSRRVAVALGARRAARPAPRGRGAPDLLGRARARHRRARRARADLRRPRARSRRSSARPSTCTPSIGARWLATTPGLSSLVPYARWHHERFDGTGYPDRRGGHEVPLTVALVAVCDCWDAMTEPRPYRVDPLVRRRDRGDASGRGPAVEPRARRLAARHRRVAPPRAGAGRLSRVSRVMCSRSAARP